MKIVVAVRCYNESKNIARFMRGYDFADEIVVSDGGSTDDSVSLLESYPKVRLFHFPEQETVNGETWNPDNPHINFVLNKAKELEPDWLIFDDMDCVPNVEIKHAIHWIFKNAGKDSSQINAFRLYLWGDDKFFPKMNNDFDMNYASLWAWKPKEINIYADETVRHGTLMGLSENKISLHTPMCLLHKSYGPDTIGAKMARYNALGLRMENPLETNGELSDLPEWAHE